MSINETTSNPIILIDNNTTLELQNLQNLSINDANVTGYISQYNYIIVSWNISSSKESIDKMQEVGRQFTVSMYSHRNFLYCVHCIFIRSFNSNLGGTYTL